MAGPRSIQSLLQNPSDPQGVSAPLKKRNAQPIPPHLDPSIKKSWDTRQQAEFVENYVKATGDTEFLLHGGETEAEIKEKANKVWAKGIEHDLEEQYKKNDESLEWELVSGDPKLTENEKKNVASISCNYNDKKKFPGPGLYKKKGSDIFVSVSGDEDSGYTLSYLVDKHLSEGNRSFFDVMSEAWYPKEKAKRRYEELMDFGIKNMGWAETGIVLTDTNDMDDLLITLRTAIEKGLDVELSKTLVEKLNGNNGSGIKNWHPRKVAEMYQLINDQKEGLKVKQEKKLQEKMQAMRDKAQQHPALKQDELDKERNDKRLEAIKDKLEELTQATAVPKKEDIAKLNEFYKRMETQINNENPATNQFLAGQSDELNKLKKELDFCEQFDKHMQEYQTLTDACKADPSKAGDARNNDLPKEVSAALKAHSLPADSVYEKHAKKMDQDLVNAMDAAKLAAAQAKPSPASRI